MSSKRIYLRALVENNGRFLVVKYGGADKFSFPGSRIREGEKLEETLIGRIYLQSDIRITSLESLGAWNLTTSKRFMWFYAKPVDPDKIPATPNMDASVNVLETAYMEPADIFSELRSGSLQQLIGNARSHLRNVANIREAEIAQGLRAFSNGQ